MTGTWLDPLRRALDGRIAPLTVFCRDDDAGWDDDALLALVEVCGRYRVPLDLAVIPAELTDERAALLLQQRANHPSRLGLHQHGWAHLNHEPPGRKCEFGPARGPGAWRADVVLGRERMAAMLGPAADDVFTPPWNRCEPGLADILDDLGFTVLSRDVSAPPAAHPRLRECPVHVDWTAKRDGVRLSLETLGTRCADAVQGGLVGLLFHHAAMDGDDLRHVDALFAVLTGAPCVRFVPLLDAAGQPDAPRDGSTGAPA